MNEEVKQKIITEVVKVPDEVFKMHQVFWRIRMRDPMLYLFARQALELEGSHIEAQLSRAKFEEA